VLVKIFVLLINPYGILIKVVGISIWSVIILFDIYKINKIKKTRAD